tara:strand:- start:1583 stop:1807 length:225 start_codon:yes stop_codon:yes gene_type:complete
MTEKETVQKKILDSLYKTNGSDCFSESKISNTKMFLQIGKSSVKEFNIGEDEKVAISDVFTQLIERCNNVQKNT